MDKILNILGDITSDPKKPSDISVSMVINEIQGLNPGDNLEVNINSYGGESFESIAMRGVIASSLASKKFNILGICASAATALFSSTDNVSIARGAMLMYHKMQVKVEGDSIALKKTAKQLEKMENEIILPDLIARTGMTYEEIYPMIVNEWWIGSEEAIKNFGFSDAGINAVMNKYQTSEINIFKNYLERKKALNVNAYSIYINHKSKLNERNL